MDTNAKNLWDVYNENCPTRVLLNQVADKWTVLILGQLQIGTLRFNVLRRAIPGITQKMLTQSLKNLERNGIVNRKVYATVPPKVEYSLTNLGISLTSILNKISHWAEENMDKILIAQKNYAQQLLDER